MLTETDKKTIDDYSIQWTRFTDNSGYYGSVELLQDIFGPLLSVESVKDQEVCDIGSGTGRVVNMLLDAGARQVVAVDPSDAFYILANNIENRKDRMELDGVGPQAFPR